MRPIDADALKKAMQGFILMPPPEGTAFLTPERIIDAAPTIDAAPECAIQAIKLCGVKMGAKEEKS